MATDRQVLDAYDECGSVKACARVLRLGEQAVRRILITHGIYPGERCKEIHRLLMSGYTHDEICARLQISLKALQMHVPYTKGSYVVGVKTRNARNVAAYRKRKKANMPDM